MMLAFELCLRWNDDYASIFIHCQGFLIPFHHFSVGQNVKKNFVGRIFLYTVFPSLVSSLRSLISWDFISPLTQSSLRPGFQDGCSGDVNWHPLSSSFYHEIKILFGMCSHHEISECGKNLIKNIPASYKPTEVEGNLTIIN